LAFLLPNFPFKNQNEILHLWCELSRIRLLHLNEGEWIFQISKFQKK
jgi:hypothetical protein